MTDSKLIIAIDGYSACGKSTLAKDIAAYMKYGFIDTGAMYRCCTLYFLENSIDLSDLDTIQSVIPLIQISFKNIDGQNVPFLNGRDVSIPIREMFVSKAVSQVAAIPLIRREMVAQQQKMAANGGFVLDGRDIGTVVFPNAHVKLFVTASIKERTNRRFLELNGSGKEVSKEEIQKNLSSRDHIDTTRKDSPLKQAGDAVLIDNTNLSKKEQLAMALALIHERMSIIVQ